MNPVTRRTFLRHTALAGAAAALSARSWAQVAGANSDVRLAVTGLNSRGKSLLNEIRKLPGVRVVALCDVDTAVLEPTAKTLGGDVKKFVDYRDLLAAPGIDAVVIATPNHQHALQAIWAMQAGKDVYLEKPVSHDLWEGRQIVAAAAKYGRLVQAGTQSRSSPAIAEAIAWVRAGNLGRITAARGLCFKRRTSIGKTTGPQAVPATVNYDLWLGPAPMAPLRRTRFHYDWHWQWATGNGDIANQGNHQMDVALRFLGETELAPRVFTAGGRFGYEDDGETPNTLVVVQDYAAAPLIFEVRGLPARPDASSNVAIGAGGSSAAEAAAGSMDKYRGISVGNLIHCEGGSVVVTADYSVAQAYDREQKLVKEFKGGASHAANFIEAVRSRRPSDLHIPVSESHVSSCLSHIANISYRLGMATPPDELRDRVRAQPALAEAVGRMLDHLAANNVDLGKTPPAYGYPLEIDTAAQRFTGNDAANALLTREYRAPYVVPAIV